MEIIKTKKFILRPLAQKDAKFLLKGMSNLNVSRYISSVPFPYELVHAKQYISKITKEMKKDDPENYVLAIEINGEVVGAIGAHRMKKGHKMEMGYWLSEEFWGQGIMPEVAKKFMPHVSKKFELKRIAARAFSENKSSMRVMEKLGMQFEGIERKGVKKNGKFYDLYVYSKIK